MEGGSTRTVSYMAKGSPVFVAWTARLGRARELARVIDGEALGVFPRVPGGKFGVPLRYLLSALITVRELRRRKPNAVIVTHPPIVAAMVVGLWALRANVPFVIDAHPTAFGAKGHVVSRLTLPLHARLARRAAAVLVASEPWAEIARGWGANAIVVHEAPEFELAERPVNDQPVCVFPGIFGGDEPVDELIAAARRLPELQVRIFGDVSRARPGLVETAPDNVVFTGWLDAGAYRSEMQNADFVVALTTEPASIMRAACEAVYLGRPMVVTDSEPLRAAFPHAVFSVNEPRALAAALRQAIEGMDRLYEAASLARQEQLQRWESQKSELLRSFKS